jgi:hypothetical protein
MVLKVVCDRDVNLRSHCEVYAWRRWNWQFEGIWWIGGRVYINENVLRKEGINFCGLMLARWLTFVSTNSRTDGSLCGGTLISQKTEVERASNCIDLRRAVVCERGSFDSFISRALRNYWFTFERCRIWRLWIRKFCKRATTVFDSVRGFTVRFTCSEFAPERRSPLQQSQ